LALARVTEIGEQAVAAIAASLAGGGPVVRAQLLASRFFEAMQRELRQLPIQDPKRAALIAASNRCERIAAASINPAALLDELRMAIAVLQAHENPSEPSPPPPTKPPEDFDNIKTLSRGRPVLRVIEGGLSNI
jgi:hypothetical protein